MILARYSQSSSSGDGFDFAGCSQGKLRILFSFHFLGEVKRN
jgi:hypothetical protein